MPSFQKRQNSEKIFFIFQTFLLKSTVKGFEKNPASVGEVGEKERLLAQIQNCLLFLMHHVNRVASGGLITIFSQFSPIFD